MKIYVTILVVLLSLVTIGSVSATTFTVNNSIGPVADYTSINAAINDVNTSNGDTILVYSGIYTENVDVDKEMTIQSHPDNSEDVIVQISSPNPYVFNVVANNVIINGINVVGSNDNIGILLNEVEGCTITENSLSNNFVGIRLDQSINNMVSYNIATLNNDTGIGLLNSSDNTVSNNIVTLTNDTGIWLFNSSRNVLSSNNASFNLEFGIRLLQSGDNTLEDNTATLNDHVGISLGESSNNNILTDNTAESNTDIGVGLLDSSDNTLTGNFVSGNSYGIWMDSSSNSLIYDNYFNNTDNTNFLGSNNGNIWNTTVAAGSNIIGGSYLGGNYWAHPDGTTGFSQMNDDADFDGFCDSPLSEYELDLNNTDYLPLSLDDIAPLISITSPADGLSTKASSITVSGLVNGTGSLPVVTVNNVAATTTLVDFNGTFTATVPLVVGANTISANVTDGAGNTDTTFIAITRTSTSSGGSSGGVGNPVIIPIQEEPEEEEEDDTSNSDGVGNATIITPEQENTEDEVVEENPELEEESESEAASGFSIMLTVGILLSTYLIYTRKD
ncbi:NosD domain-containing protein [Methanococcoides sp. LMO-2]|uniref:NosD domain-containing protein n=1 Tax=Methanococcoides cohabitans TaxID=3136559 RepID=A0ABU9KRJ0_9EURY